MSAPARRKLAAIVFADIAGYTDKTQRDEAGTLSLRDRVERLIKSSTLSHHGRVVKTLGDGAMLEFASAVEAVSCAIDIQDQMEALNAELGLEEPIALRVGVHVGDVVEEADDLYGNAVNIASRVHGMARPGGICITREVYVQIKPILKLSFEPVAGASSDRLPEPVEVFAIVGGEDLHPVSNAPRTASRRPLLLAAVLLGCVAVIAAVYSMFDAMKNDPATTQSQVHRILLPDWVTPGEWFVLDAGQERSAKLTVYFGNRRATTRIDNGQLLVQTPIDLPTAQTAISIFEGNSPEPLMNQQTQVIKYGSLAMNSGSVVDTDPPASRGPEVDVSSGTLIQPKSGTTVPNSLSAKLDSSKLPPPAKSGNSSVPTPTLPSAGADSLAPSAKVVGVPKVPGVKEYDRIVTMVQDDDFRFDVDGANLEASFGEFGEAMKTIGLAQRGDAQEARKKIQAVRVNLKTLDPEQAKEVEALLKTAEACLEEPMIVRARSGNGTSRRSHPKWAEAFAFSMNEGTRNVPGLMMIDLHIRSKNIADAKRAIAVMKKRPDLTESEQKALNMLEARVRRAESGEGRAPEKPSPDHNP